MTSRSRKALLSYLTPRCLIALLVILGVSFVAVVLVPGLELAGELVDSTIALKLVGEQQRQSTLVRASLDSMHDRLGARGYIQDSVEQLRAAAAKLDTKLRQTQTAPPPAWFGLAGPCGANGGPWRGFHAPKWRIFGRGSRRRSVPWSASTACRIETTNPP